MPATKKKPRPELEPVSHTYPALVEALNEYRLAEAYYERVRGAIDHGCGLIIEADKTIEELTAKVEGADRADDKRSASMILIGKSAPMQWSGESARLHARHAEKRRESLIRGKAELEIELKRKDLTRKIKFEAVRNEIIKIKEPIVAKKAERVVALQAELTAEIAGLNALIDDPLPDLGNEIVARHNADKARALAWARLGKRHYPQWSSMRIGSSTLKK